jgi:hypothetical protein
LKELSEMESKEGKEGVKAFFENFMKKEEGEWQEVENKARESMRIDSVKIETQQEETTPFQEVDKVINLMLDPKNGIEIKTRMYHLRNYYHCFVGSDYIDWLLKNFSNLKTREEALDYGTYLMDHHAFVHVCGSVFFIFIHPIGTFQRW